MRHCTHVCLLPVPVLTERVRRSHRVHRQGLARINAPHKAHRRVMAVEVLMPAVPSGKGSNQKPCLYYPSLWTPFFKATRKFLLLTFSALRVVVCTRRKQGVVLLRCRLLGYLFVRLLSRQLTQECDASSLVQKRSLCLSSWTFRPGWMLIGCPAGGFLDGLIVVGVSIPRSADVGSLRYVCFG